MNGVSSSGHAAIAAHVSTLSKTHTSANASTVAIQQSTAVDDNRATCVVAFAVVMFAIICFILVRTAIKDLES